MLKRKEKGSNFYLSLIHENSTVVDLMQPLLGFYSIPTAAYYGGDYASGELLSIVHARGEDVSLPDDVKLLINCTSDYEYAEPANEEKQKNKQLQGGEYEKKTKKIHTNNQSKVLVGPDRLCNACLLEKPRAEWSKKQYHKPNGGRCKACVDASQPKPNPHKAAQDAKRGQHIEFTALKASANQSENLSVSSMSEKAMMQQTVEDCPDSAFDFFLVIADLEGVLRKKQSTKHKGASINIIHHPWVFPRAPPGKRLGANIHAGWVPVASDFPSPIQEEAKSSSGNVSKNSLRQDRLTQTRISIHPDKRDSWAMCFSPNNAKLTLDLAAPMSIFFTIAHTLPKEKSSLRAVVTLQVLLHKSVPALSNAVNTATTLKELLLEVEQIVGSSDVLSQTLRKVFTLQTSDCEPSV